MSKLVFGIYQHFFALGTFLGLAVLPYKMAVICCYLVLAIDPFVFNALMPYLKAIYTILDFNESCLGTALKISCLLI